jgi:hypothetical protein
MRNKLILSFFSTMIAGTSLFGAISLDTVTSSTADVGTSGGAYFKGLEARLMQIPPSARLQTQRQESTTLDGRTTHRHFHP